MISSNELYGIVAVPGRSVTLSIHLSNSVPTNHPVGARQEGSAAVQIWAQSAPQANCLKTFRAHVLRDVVNNDGNLAFVSVQFNASVNVIDVLWLAAGDGHWPPDAIAMRTIPAPRLLADGSARLAATATTRTNFAPRLLGVC